MRAFLAIAAMALAASLVLPAHAATSSVFLEDLTSPEVRDAIKAGRTTILVPIGATEQNGAHMALGKHNARARWLAGHIAARLGNALVAPVVSYVPEGSTSPPAGHMRFPGTISIPEDAFEKMLEGAARSFAAHGFTDVVLLGDHGGYGKSLAKVAQRLNREWARAPARVVLVPEYYRAATSDFAAMLKSEGFTDREIGVHAGLGDTALTLAVDPALVREAQMREGASPGVEGDPRRATAALGERGLAMIVDRTVDAIPRAIAAAHASRPVK